MNSGGLWLGWLGCLHAGLFSDGTAAGDVGEGTGTLFLQLLRESEIISQSKNRDWLDSVGTTLQSHGESSVQAPGSWPHGWLLRRIPF